MPAVWRKNAWNLWHVLGALALVSLAVAVAWPAWADIIQIARVDEEASHILLVPIVVLWLVFVRRRRIRRLRPTGQWVGVLLAGLGVAISIYGYQRDIQSFWHGGAILAAVGALVSVVGREVLVAYLPAFCVLAFMVPVPGTFRQPFALRLESATAIVTQQIFDVLGVAVERSGNQLSINGTPVEIAEACNGMRMVFTLVLVSYAYAFGTPLRGYVRFLVLAMCPVSAIVCNVIRLVPTIYLFGQLPREQAWMVHDIGGWVMLVIAFGLLFGIIRVLQWAMLPVANFTLAYD